MQVLTFGVCPLHFSSYLLRKGIVGSKLLNFNICYCKTICTLFIKLLVLCFNSQACPSPINPPTQMSFNNPIYMIFKGAWVKICSLFTKAGVISFDIFSGVSTVFVQML